MRQLTFVVVGCFLSLRLFAADAPPPDLLDLSLQDLMNVTITTSAKAEETLPQSTSVVSVIRRQDIETSGVQTLYDLLKRVPGFFPSQQATWSLITSRGLPSDGNDHFLLLVDGHPQNSIVGQGYQQQDLLPTLEQVEQIEIIRGPGSVLWGSSAVMGIVNIITRTHVDKARLKVSAQAGPGAQYVNYMEGIGNGKDTKGFYSLTAWGARGYQYTEGNESAVAFPWGSQPTGGFRYWPRINQQREGFDLYAKVNFNSKTEVIARLLRTSFNYVWDEWNGNGDAEHELGNRRAYLSVRRYLTISDSLKLDVNFYGDYNLQNRTPLDIKNPGYSSLVQDQSNEEFATGIETMATWLMTESNTFKVGLKFVRTEIGPNRDARLNPTTNTPVNSGNDVDTNGTPFSYNVPYFGTEPGFDHSVALYAEDSQKFGDTTVFGGGRLDMNDFREKNTIFLPRAGIVHNFSSSFVGKYIFNTGYLRPSAVYSKTVGFIVDKNRGGAFPITRVTDSESVQSHDLQFSYLSPSTYAAITLFYMSVENFLSFDANNTPQGYKNIGDASSFGAELESQHKISSRWMISENISYAKGKIDNAIHHGALSDPTGRTLNYPMFIANLGATWNPYDGHSISLHTLAWDNMRYIKAKDQLFAGQTSPVYGNLGPEVYLDANYLIKNLWTRDLDFNFFVWNILDNQNRIGMVVNNGTYRPPGRTVGAGLSYQF